jgi:TctA family transporter
MIGFIIWIIGVILTIRAAMEIWRWRGITTEKRLVAIILVILTSWIGLAVYYFWGRDNLPQMLK